MTKEDNCRPQHLVLLSALILLPLLALLAFFGPLNRAADEPLPVVKEALPPKADDRLRSFPVKDTAALVRALDSAWKSGQGADTVPNVAPEKLPEGLDQLETSQKKTIFVRAVLPHVLQVNRGIMAEREMLQQIRERLGKGLKLREAETAQLEEVARRYRIDDGIYRQARARPAVVVEELLNRVDIIPPSLVLAQAAIESAWGASRYVIQGNNLFGQLIFTVEKGMIPQGIGNGATFALARFGSLGEAVESYTRNLNSLGAYEDFRRMRAEMRAADGTVDPRRLAEGLTAYSARGEGYVEDLKWLIRVNRFQRFDSARLFDVGLESVKALLLSSNAGV